MMIHIGSITWDTGLFRSSIDQASVALVQLPRAALSPSVTNDCLLIFDPSVRYMSTQRVLVDGNSMISRTVFAGTTKVQC